MMATQISYDIQIIW